MNFSLRFKGQNSKKCVVRPPGGLGKRIGLARLGTSCNWREIGN